MYLVLLRHSLDDFPVELFCSEVDAIAAAKLLSWEVPENIKTIFRSDASTPCQICVLRFVNGKPLDVIFKRSWEDEGGDDDDDSEVVPEPAPTGDLVNA